jgi:nicotinamidase/pyrazinamidase
MSYKITESDILVIVDLQNDFCPGGTLPVPRGDEIVSIVNRLGERFRHVVLSQDWHPALHKSFASTHPGKQPFETVSFAYGPQVLWPDHCVQGTPGAQFHAGLDVPHAELVLRKGYRREIDSYSVFYENDRATPTGLAGYLRERGFARVFLVGLALDVCVRYSAEDAQRCGLEAVVIEDACRGIDVGGSMVAAGQAFAKSAIACVGVEAID